MFFIETVKSVAVMLTTVIISPAIEPVAITEEGVTSKVCEIVVSSDTLNAAPLALVLNPMLSFIVPVILESLIPPNAFLLSVNVEFAPTLFPISVGPGELISFIM